MRVCPLAPPSLLQEIFLGPTLVLVLHLSNVSRKDNLHNLTCEAENQAGPGREMVPLDIECKWKGRGGRRKKKNGENKESGKNRDS